MVAALLNNISRSELEEITQLGQIIMNGGSNFNYTSQKQNSNGNLMDDPERDKGEPSQQPKAEKDKDQEDKKPEIIAQLGGTEKQEPHKEPIIEEPIIEASIEADELKQPEMEYAFDISAIIDNKGMENLSNISPAATPENEQTIAMVGELQEQALKRSNAV